MRYKTQSEDASLCVFYKGLKKTIFAAETLRETRIKFANANYAPVEGYGG